MPEALSIVASPDGSRPIRFENAVRPFAMIFGVTMTLCLCACTNTTSPGDGMPAVNPADFTGGTGVATLSWAPPTRNVDGTALNDLAGYYIYYGKSPDNLNGIIRVSDPLETTHTVDHLGHGTYYFKVVPFSARGVKGSATPLVSKTIP